MMRRALVVLLAVLGFASVAHAQPKPAFSYESLMDTYFDDESGLISFREYDLIFMPEGELKAAVAVVNSENTVVKSFEFFPEYRWTEGVFGKAQVRGPADVTLTEPGIYNIVLLVNGEMATRLPVALEQTSAGDDPFDPRKTYRFYGLWSVFAHLTILESGDMEYPRLTFWVGGRDLPEGEDGDQFFVTLKRDGEVIGHSKRTLGHIASGHYKRVTSEIYQPHERRREANAVFVPMEEWTRDGEYELIVTRQSDDQPVRAFKFTASGGEIERLPQSELGHEPRIDYMAPRVTKKGSNQYEFVEVIWIGSGN